MGEEEEDRHWSEPLNPLKSVREPKPPEFNLTDSWQLICGMKAAGAGVLSGAMGGAMGLLFQNYDNMIIKDDLPIKQQLRMLSKFAWQGARPWAKNFMFFGLWYSGMECASEHARGRSDVYNHVIAGCFTGAALAWQSGPSAMALGCVGIAAFSVATEAYFHRE